MNEREKMLAGEWYDASYDEDLVKERAEAAERCYEFDALRPTDTEAREENLKEILQVEKIPEGTEVLSPFLADYGTNVHLGERVHVGHGCYFMDGASITIGHDAFIGPDCGFYTASHPMNYAERNKGMEKTLPITVGNNCWFGAKVSVLPGVHIGNGCVIAAGVPAQVKGQVKQR